MDFHTLNEMIEAGAHAQAHRVWVQACENVGECTYAKFEPSYLKSVKFMIGFYHHFYPDETTRALQNPKFKQVLIGNVLYYYQRMYEQPCLICDACRNRISTWCQSEMDNLENLLWYLDEELALTLRSPIYADTPIPGWIAEWMHSMFWTQWVREACWK